MTTPHLLTAMATTGYAPPLVDRLKMTTLCKWLSIGDHCNDLLAMINYDRSAMTGYWNIGPPSLFSSVVNLALSFLSSSGRTNTEWFTLWITPTCLWSISLPPRRCYLTNHPTHPLHPSLHSFTAWPVLSRQTWEIQIDNAEFFWGGSEAFIWNIAISYILSISGRRDSIDLSLSGNLLDTLMPIFILKWVPGG